MIKINTIVGVCKVCSQGWGGVGWGKERLLLIERFKKDDTTPKTTYCKNDVEIWPFLPRYSHRYCYTALPNLDS